MPNKYLVVGQKPPPVHGSNLMFSFFTETLNKLKHKVFVVEKDFSFDQKNIGKLSFRKIVKIPYIALNLIRQIYFEKFDLCFYFISIKKPSFYFDVLLLTILYLTKTKYIIYLHAIGINKLSKKSGLLTKFLTNFTMKNSSGVIIVAELLRGDVSSLFHNEKIFVLHNCFPDICNIKKTIKKSEKLPITVSFLSNLRPSKGVLEFLEIACKIKKNNDEVRFILAGPARTDKILFKVKSFISNNELNKYINIIGPVYGSEKENFFQETDIFLFPSKNEAFGLVNLEAMQWSLPIVASDVGAIPSIVRNGINGFTMNYRDIDGLSEKVNILIQNKELRTKMGTAGRKIFENEYSQEVYLKRVTEMLLFFK